MTSRIVIAAVLSLAAIASPAAAEDSIQLVSGSGDDTAVTPRPAIGTGAAFYFETTENVPGTGDTDGLKDVFRFQGRTITLVSGSNPAASGGQDATFSGASTDGSRMFFTTKENIPGTGDTDDLSDVYQAQDGTITLLSGSNPAATGGQDVFFSKATRDGATVFFETEEDVPGTGDADALFDVYRAQGGVLTLMTGSNPAASGGKSPIFRDVTEDGNRVLFETRENVPGTGDTDDLNDVFRGDGTTITAMTPSNPAASGGMDASFSGSLSGGDLVFFTTSENIPGTSDTDGLRDGYVRIAAPGFNLLAPITDNTPSAQGGRDEFLASRFASDGTAVFFTAENVPGTGDTDDLFDFYLLRAGDPILLTGSNPAGTGGTGAALNGRATSDDLDRVYFITKENIPGTGDTDGLDDFYLAAGSASTGTPPVLSLVTGNNPVASGGKDVGTNAGQNVSLDGKRFAFDTDEDIPGTGDTDGLRDVYLAEAGTIKLISGNNPAASGGTGAFIDSISDDGSRVFFATTERIPGTGDNDDGSDAYVFGPTPPPLPPSGGGTTTGGGGTGGGSATPGAASDGGQVSVVPPLADLAPADLTAFRTRRARFAAAARGGSIARSKPKVGTTVSYTLSEDATVRFTVERRGAGRRVSGRCVRLSRKNRKARKCDLLLAGSFTHDGHAGTNTFTFTGRVRNRKLPVGRHNLVATATDRAGNVSAPVRARFTIVKAPVRAPR